MSHHFTAEFAVIPPGKEPTSNKLKRNNESVSAKKREAKKLDIDNKQMEWKLQQLKVVMAKEKEDREKLGYIWKSGSVEKHSRNILGRTVSASAAVGNPKKLPHAPATKSAKTKKIHVLKDEPLDLPKHTSSSKALRKALIESKPDDEALTFTNGNNSTEVVNQEEWISVAAEKGSEDIIELQSNVDGNIPIETIQAINPSAVGLYFLRWGRKRLLMAVDGIIRKPKGGWETEVYYPYVAKITNEMQMRPEPPPSHRRSPRKPPAPSTRSIDVEQEEQDGGKLLEGCYDEDENSRAFQQAVSQWRNNGPAGDIRFQYNGNERSTPEMSVHAVQATPAKTKIEFVEDVSLTYMEKVLLNKHRKTDVPSLRGTGNLLNDLNALLNGDDLEQYENKENMETIFTEEEENERDSYCQLFTPSGVTETLPQESSSIIAITEVDEDVQYDDEETECIVEVDDKRKEHSHIINKVQISEDFLIKNEDDVAKISHTVLPASTQRYEERSNVDRKSTENKVSSSNTNMKSHTSRKSLEIVEKPVLNHSLEDVGLVRAISELPLNPDAHYTPGLNDFFVWSEARNDRSDFIYHEPEKITKTKVTKTSSNEWNPNESFVNNSNTSSYRTSSPISDDGLLQELNDESIASCDTNSAVEDKKAIDKLEWELASQTGNIDADGRISRMIDDWSDDDLGIIEDTGAGSGLSTPDITSQSLPHSALNSIRVGSMHNDFQKMEQAMLENFSDEYSDNEF